MRDYLFGVRCVVVVYCIMGSCTFFVTKKFGTVYDRKNVNPLDFVHPYIGSGLETEYLGQYLAWS